MVWDDDTFMDLVERTVQYELMSLGNIYEAFTRWDGRAVVDFTHPRPHLSVNGRRLGGWPPLEGTRIGYDTVALALADGSIPRDRINHYYPEATPDAVADAVSFDQEVRAVAA